MFTYIYCLKYVTYLILQTINTADTKRIQHAPSIPPIIAPVD